MLAMGFHQTWVDRIRECITTPSFSVLIKGLSYGFIRSNRGLRQGNPLSPYIFTMVMEYFSCLMESTVIRKHIVPLHRLVQPHISHLIYADNLLVFFEAIRWRHGEIGRDIGYFWATLGAYTE